MKPLHIRLVTLSIIVLVTALTRLLPHPPNVAPVAALALFGASVFERKWLGLLAPLAAMLLSDALIGFHGLMPYVYGCFAISWVLGLTLLKKPTIITVAGAALLSSVVFFLVTNFGVWFGSTFYPQTSAGLVACYTAALPFFQNTLLGDLAYSGLLFGTYALLKRQVSLFQVV